MKTAILFYGFARSFEKAKENYKKFLPDADVFINTYSTTYEPDDGKNKTKCKCVDEKMFTNVFSNIKYLSIQPYSRNYFQTFVSAHKLPAFNKVYQMSHRIVSMMYSIKEVTNAKIKYENDNKFNYDCVILTRLDLRFDTPFVIPQNLFKLSYSIGEGYHSDMTRRVCSSKVFGTDRWINDQLVMGNSEIINVLGLIYDNMPEFNKENIMINGETLFGWQLIKNNIEFSPEDITTYQILRE